MIRIQIEKKDCIDSITVTGHAGYGISGTDIVCASVSSILITTINAMLRVDEKSIQYTKKEAYVKLEILLHSDMIDLLMENMVSLFEELEKDYKKYVKINKWGGVTYDKFHEIGNSIICP